MKRIAGEKGICFASQVHLRKQLGVGKTTLKNSIQYLLDHKWITFAGDKVVQTRGGAQEIKTYKINDLWKMNVNYYEGGSETAPLTRQRGVQNEPKGGSETATKKNQENKNEELAIQGIAGKEIQECIYLFKDINPLYEQLFKNTTQRSAMGRLIEKFGAEKIKGTLKALPLILEKPYAPKITTPYELEKNLAKLIMFHKQEQNKGVEKNKTKFIFT